MHAIRSKSNLDAKAIRAVFSSVAAWILLVSRVGSLAAVHYVDLNSANPMPPYTNWATAATVIQDAVDAAAAGDEVVVTNGIYTTGGRSVGANLLINRVAVDKPLTLRSVNGPQVTIIQGHQGTNYNGADSLRCVYLAAGALLSGFTLTNGAAGGGYYYYPNGSGGGVFCATTNAVVTNCVLVGDTATGYGGSGGGACGGTLYNCTLNDNWSAFGGGAEGCILNLCTLTNNSAF